MIHTTFNRSITAGSRGAGPRKNGVWGGGGGGGGVGAVLKIYSLNENFGTENKYK